MGLKLVQLGCFDQPKDGWDNYDITPHIFIARVPFLAFVLFKLKIIESARYEQHKHHIFKKVYYLNLNKRLKFSNESIDAFFSSHVFEHLYLDDLRRLLKEIFRTLKPGGCIRTVLPDLDQMITYYTPTNPTKFLEAVFENHNSENYKNYHKWMYTRESFATELVSAGFDSSKIQFLTFNNYGQIYFNGMDNRPYNSFYIEAQK